MIKRKIYYLPRFGQLGNQLSILAHLIAFAETYNYEIIFPQSAFLQNSLEGQDEAYGPVRYSNTINSKTASFLANKIIKIITGYKNLRIGKLLIVNKEFIVDKQIDADNLPDIIIITNWLFRYYKGVEVHQQKIRNLLALNKQSYTGAISFLSGLATRFREHNLIGVHVRRGDYAGWENGKYFYSVSYYYALMLELSLTIKNCVFVICSNEALDFENTGNLNIEFVKGSAVEDLFVLSQCDFILGPPSTFSGWAAFWGERPIHFIERDDENISVENFSLHLL